MGVLPQPNAPPVGWFSRNLRGDRTETPLHRGSGEGMMNAGGAEAAGRRGSRREWENGMTTIRQVLGDAPNVCPHTETIDTPLGPLCKLCDTQLPRPITAAIRKQADERIRATLTGMWNALGPFTRDDLGALMDGAQDAVMNWLPPEKPRPTPKRSGPDIVQLPEGLDPLTDPVYRRVEAHNEREMRRYEAAKAASDA